MSHVSFLSYYSDTVGVPEYGGGGPAASDRLICIWGSLQNLTFDVVSVASVQAQFMLPLSNVRVTKAFVGASAIIFTPPSVVFPVKVTTSCWTSSSRVAETVKT